VHSQPGPWTNLVLPSFSQYGNVAVFEGRIAPDFDRGAKTVCTGSGGAGVGSSDIECSGSIVSSGKLKLAHFNSQV
jgi:hypothetical protein